MWLKDRHNLYYRNPLFKVIYGEEFEEFEEHPQDVMEQYQDYPYDYDY
ncbi:Uncharacterised protein [Escherichia coli]|uniref:Uncharacterized protein n=1 Tax=Escherichia coli TaxID=562 RepID=A0A484WQV0_ECOLX|nr:Uncharacterised protein [Escherichia coli]